MNETPLNIGLRELQAANLRDVRQIYNIDGLLERLDSEASGPLRLRQFDPEERDVASPLKASFLGWVRALEHACAVLEIGSVAGALSDPTGEFSELLGPYLRFRNLSRSLGLPLGWGLQFPQYQYLGTTASGPYQGEWFANFLTLDNAAQNSDLKRLLDVVGRIKPHAKLELFKASQSKQSLVAALSKPAEERTEVQCAIAGLEAILLFSEDLLRLLERATDASRLVWRLYRTYFASPALMQFVDNVSRLSDETPNEVAAFTRFHAAAQGNFDSLTARLSLDPDFGTIAPSARRFFQEEQ